MYNDIELVPQTIAKKVNAMVFGLGSIRYNTVNTNDSIHIIKFNIIKMVFILIVLC